MQNSYPIPPCPDPEKYVLIRTKEGNFWRKRRGMGEKQAVLNERFKVHVEGMAITAPAAKRIVNKLKPHLNGLATGRLTVKISAMLRKQLTKTGIVDYLYLKEFDFQPNYPLDKLLQVPFEINDNGSALKLNIPIANGTIKQNNKIVSEFYFEVITVSGDCTNENDLELVSVNSETYKVISGKKDLCRFSLIIPEKPWFIVLKVCCVTGDEKMASPRNYGMKVIAVG